MAKCYLLDLTELHAVISSYQKSKGIRYILFPFDEDKFAPYLFQLLFREAYAPTELFSYERKVLFGTGLYDYVNGVLKRTEFGTEVLWQIKRRSM